MTLLLALIAPSLAAEPTLCVTNHDQTHASVLMVQLDDRPVAQLSPGQRNCTPSAAGEHKVRLVRVLISAQPTHSKLAQTLTGPTHYAAQLAHITRRYTTLGERDLQLAYEVRAAVLSGAWDAPVIAATHQQVDTTFVLGPSGAHELVLQGGASLLVNSELPPTRKRNPPEPGWTEHPEAWLAFRVRDGAQYPGYKALLSALGLEPLYVEPTLDQLLDDPTSDELPEY